MAKAKQDDSATTPAPAAPADPVTGTTAEQHAEAAGTPDWLLASTRAYHGWALGKEMSRAQYDAAVEKAANCSTGSLKDKDGKDVTGLL